MDAILRRKMNEDKEKRLIEKYPRIFARGEYRPEGAKYPYAYPSVGDGWFDILDAACGLIKSHLKNLESSGYRVLDSRNDFEDGDFDEDDKVVWAVQALQIKEKFGGLRFYTSGGDDYTRGIIAMAESMSYRTCEVCGSPGEPRNDGWVKTLCEEHHAADRKAREEREREYARKRKLKATQNKVEQ